MSFRLEIGNELGISQIAATSFNSWVKGLEDKFLGMLDIHFNLVRLKDYKFCEFDSTH